MYFAKNVEVDYIVGFKLKPIVGYELYCLLSQHQMFSNEEPGRNTWSSKPQYIGTLVISLSSMIHVATLKQVTVLTLHFPSQH